MSQMRIASVAHDLYAAHSQAIIDLGPNPSFGYRRPEAGPARAGVEFCVRAEQVVSAANALVDSRFVEVPVLARVGPFRSFFPGYVELLRREYLPPLCVGLFDFLATVCVGISLCGGRRRIPIFRTLHAGSC